MSLIKRISPRSHIQRRYGVWRRQTAFLAYFAAISLLAGCGGGAETGEVGFVEGFLGGVMADEPRAALIGRDTLSAGGTAADAAVAAYFTMAVTMPGGAGLGGGGVCLVYDPDRERVDAYDFLPRAPQRDGVKFAVPGNVRGMFAVHARHGRLNWADLLRPAEVFAREGHPVARAFVRDLNANAESLRRHPDTARAFGLVQDTIREGRPLRQVELATILSSVRIRGAGDFYQGASARQFVEAVRQVGGTLTIDDMRTYLPRLQAPLEAPYGNDVIYVSGGGGIVAGRVWAMLHDSDRYDDATDEAARAHLLAEASARAYAAAIATPGPVSMTPETGRGLIAGFDPTRRTLTDRGAGGAERPDSGPSQNGASLVVVDRFGQVVACGYTMGRPFGTGILAPGTGILLVPADVGTALSQPAALVIANRVNEQTFLGAAISGGSAAGLAPVPLDVRTRELPFDGAVARPRLFDPARPDLVFLEPSWDASAMIRLRELGYRLTEVNMLGRINGFYCPNGLPRAPTCQFVHDPRGFGLAASADE